VGVGVCGWVGAGDTNRVREREERDLSPPLYTVVYQANKTIQS
jgi:hypothetical protein